MNRPLSPDCSINAGSLPGELQVRDSELQQPRRRTARLELRLGLRDCPDLPGPGGAAQRLAARIARLSDDHMRVSIVPVSRSGLEAVRDGRCEIGLDAADQALAVHPELAFFAGLPRFTGLDAVDIQAWLELGNGQQLWDDLLADAGVKPLLAGHSRAASLLWTRRPLPPFDDLAGLRLAAQGLSCLLASRLDADVMDEPLPRAALALGAGLIDGMETDSAAIGLELGLQRSARHVYRAAFNGTGRSLMLAVSRSQWQRMSGTEREILRVATAEECRWSAVEARANMVADEGRLIAGHGIAFERLPPQLVRNLDLAADQVVRSIAERGPLARSIWASITAFKTRTSPAARLH